MTTGLAREACYAGIAILGEPDYYPKYGFMRGRDHGITCEFGAPDPLMCYKLNDSFDSMKGLLIESSVFENIGSEEDIAAMTAEFPYHKPLTLSCQWLYRERLGRICEIQKNSYHIRFFEQELSGKLNGSFYHNGQELPVVGDYVTFDYNPSGDSVILSVCERSSVLKRPDHAGHADGFAKTLQEQVMAANFDYVFIVASLNDNYNYNRIGRYVSITLQGGGIPVVILTKVDLCSNPGRYVREIEELSDKVRVHTISALYGIGLEELQEYVQPGRTIILLGSSGVGKSTLVNAIAGEEIMKTSEIREEDSKGRHTTTHRQMLCLPNGAVIIDTPGMREIGMCDVEEGIDETFSDIVELESRCRFRDCKHEKEPGCAVRQAIEEGLLSEERLKLYRGLHQESDKAKKMKDIAKARRKINKSRR